MPEEATELALLIATALSRQQPASGTGWIRQVRLQQQLQAKQLAEKMGVSPARVSVLEKDELRGAVTLKMMQKAAQALDCRFVYALVPNTAPTKTKPRIRLDAASMQRDSAGQSSALQQEYLRSLSQPTPD